MSLSLDKLRRFAVFIGWAALLVTIGSTLSPIDVRPRVPDMSPDAERFLAYLVASSLLTFAYPRRRWLVLPGIVLLAVGLEWLQTLEASRHGLPQDALVKIAGAVAGAVLAGAFEYLNRRLRSAV